MGRVSAAKERLIGSRKGADLDRLHTVRPPSIRSADKAGREAGKFLLFSLIPRLNWPKTAIDEDWQQRRPGLDAIFLLHGAHQLRDSKSIAPLTINFQKEIHAKFGCVLGWPAVCSWV